MGSSRAHVPTQMARLEAGVPTKIGMGARMTPRKKTATVMTRRRGDPPPSSDAARGVEFVEAEALKHVGREEHAGGDGAEREEVSEDAVVETRRQIEVFPGAQAGGRIGHEVKIHGIKITPSRNAPEPADGEAVAVAAEVGGAVEPRE
jgi:hypothetical protein